MQQFRTGRRQPLCGIGLLLLAAAITSAPVGAQSEFPVEIQNVSLRVDGAESTILVIGEAGMSSRIEPGSSGYSGADRLTVHLPNAVPGPSALDRTARSGIVSEVEVGFSVPDGVPTTRLVVHGRAPIEAEVAPSSGGLVIRVRAAGGGADAPRRRPADPLAEATRKLEGLETENQSLKQRMAELHADRLELVESLRQAREELAAAPAPDPELQAQLTAEAKRLETELEAARAAVADRDRELADARAAVSGAETARQALAARVTELQDRLEAAGSEADLGQAAARDAERLESEVQRLGAELQTAATESAELQQRLAALEDESSELRARLAAADGTGTELDAERRRIAQLARELERSRSTEAVLRSALRAAPGLLGAEAVAVRRDADRCAPLRPSSDARGVELECVPAGGALQVLNLRPGWLRVRAESGREGWVEAGSVLPAHAVDAGRQREELSRFRAERVQLEGELEAARAESAEAGRQLGQARARVTDLERRAGRADQAEDQSARLQRELETSRRDLALAQQELDGMREWASQAEKRFDALLQGLGLEALLVSPEAEPCLTLRSDPGTGSAKLDCLDPGTSVTVQDGVADWLAVATAAGARGWVAARFLEPAGVRDATDRLTMVTRPNLTTCANAWRGWRPSEAPSAPANRRSRRHWRRGWKKPRPTRSG